MRRVIGLLVVAVMLLLVAASPVLAYLYRAPLTIMESTGTSYTAIGVNCSAPVTWLIANGFITTATALDTRVETFGGDEQIHMMASDRIVVFVPSLPGYSQLNWYFTTGNTELPDFPIITGYGGYVTVVDAPALELGSDFSIEFNGWVDTSCNNTLLLKEGAFEICVEDGDIVARILGGSPTTARASGYSSGEYTVTAWADTEYLHIKVKKK